jgi:uncharacterized protein DUF1801
MKPSQPKAVADVFAAYPPRIRRKLFALRELILETAATTDGVGRIEETLKWGEPAYTTPETRIGSTIRIDWKPSTPDRYYMYFICTTKLVDTFRFEFPNDFIFEGNRALVFWADAAIPREPLAECIAAALTYHRKAKRRPG